MNNILNDKFDQELAKVLARAIKAGKFKLEGIDRAIFLAGRLSAAGKKEQ